ncbi:Speckle-type POZ protein, partial [Trachymyrmex cornetzi]
TDIVRISETSTEYKDRLLSKYDLHHCRTKCLIRKTNFQWSIGSFWKICDFMDTLTSSNIEGECYKIDMHINRKNDKLCFFINSTVFNPEEQINIQRYNVYIQGIDGAILCTVWKRFYFNTDPLYEVCLQTLRLNKTIYLPNNTLSIHFTFETFESISHISIYENILDKKEFIAMNNFASDSIVTFVVEGNRLCVNKSLACAASPVFNEMLKKCNKDVKGQAKGEIEISDVTYDIFKIVILYINGGDVFEFNFDVNNDTISQINTLTHLLAACNTYHIKNLKVICEKRLIAYVTKDNVISCLNIAIVFNAVYLESYTKKFIKLHLDDIKSTTQFLETIKINPKILSDIYNSELFVEYASYVKHNDTDLLMSSYENYVLQCSGERDLCTILISSSYAVITVVNRTLSLVSVGFVTARGLMRCARLYRTANVV